MDDFTQHRLQIERDFALKILDVYEAGNFSKEEVITVARYINEEMEGIDNKTDLITFLDYVSSNWPALSGVVSKEKEITSEEKDSEVYSGVLALAQNGKIDKAIELAKSNNN